MHDFFLEYLLNHVLVVHREDVLYCCVQIGFPLWSSQWDILFRYFLNCIFIFWHLIKHINFLSNILHLQASQYQEKNIIKFAIYLGKVLQRNKISFASLLLLKFPTHQFWVYISQQKTSSISKKYRTLYTNKLLSIPSVKGVFISSCNTGYYKCRVSEKGEKNRKMSFQAE